MKDKIKEIDEKFLRFITFSDEDWWELLEWIGLSIILYFFLWRESSNIFKESLETNTKVAVFLISFAIFLLFSFAHLLSGNSFEKYFVTIKRRRLNNGRHFGQLFASFILILLLLFNQDSALILFPMLVVLLIRLMRTQDVLFLQNEQLEYQKTEAELTALKAQVNPHFLFNSLNSIYGMAIEESPKSAASIQQLSEMMRYTLEKSAEKMVSVSEEINFLKNYIELNQLRIPKQDNISLTTTIKWDEKPYNIAPLLLTPIVENAFKYGISIDYPCFIDLNLDVANDRLYFVAKNKILQGKSLEKGTGTGLENLQKRLNFTYPNKHRFEIVKLDSEFIVNLEINLL